MKYALITGGSGGIGCATVRELASHGWGIAIHYHHNQGTALKLADEISQFGVPALAVQADITKQDQVQLMVDSVLNEFPQLDALVCNAGVSHFGLLTDVDSYLWRKIFSVNVDGTFYCCQAVLPHFIHRKQGVIVTVSSMWGQVGASCEVAYSAAKGAVISFSKALAKELGPSQIRVNCVAPGVINTEMNRHLSSEDLKLLKDETPLGRIGTAEEVARTIAFLTSDESSFFTGQVLSPNGGIVIV